MCARFTVLSDTPIPSAIAGCVIPISRHSTIWMRSRCAGGNFQCRAVFSRRTSALLHLIICPPNQMVGSEPCRARKKYCTNHTHPLSPQKSRFKRVWRRYKNGAKPREVEFLLRRRVELNSMTSQQLVTFLERKLEQHRIRKVVPNADELAAAY